MANLTRVLGGIFGKGASEIINSVGTVIDNVVTTKEERETLKIELTKEINRVNEAMADKALKEIELENQELASARSRQVDMAKAGVKDSVPSVLAYISVIGFILIVIGLSIFGFGTLSAEQALLVGSLLGTLGSNSTSVINYYFGSSAGSRRKSDEMEELRKQLIKLREDDRSKTGT